VGLRSALQEAGQIKREFRGDDGERIANDIFSNGRANWKRGARMRAANQIWQRNRLTMKRDNASAQERDSLRESISIAEPGTKIQFLHLAIVEKYKLPAYLELAAQKFVAFSFPLTLPFPSGRG
jgi:hypothetical protein